jgi:hypothetical protein
MGSCEVASTDEVLGRERDRFAFGLDAVDLPVDSSLAFDDGDRKGLGARLVSVGGSTAVAAGALLVPGVIFVPEVELFGAGGFFLGRRADVPVGFVVDAMAPPLRFALPAERRESTRLLVRFFNRFARKPTSPTFVSEAIPTTVSYLGRTGYRAPQPSPKVRIRQV